MAAQSLHASLLLMERIVDTMIHFRRLLMYCVLLLTLAIQCPQNILYCLTHYSYFLFSLSVWVDCIMEFKSHSMNEWGMKIEFPYDIHNNAVPVRCENYTYLTVHPSARRSIKSKVVSVHYKGKSGWKRASGIFYATNKLKCRMSLHTSHLQKR